MGCAESRNTVQPQSTFSVVTSSSSPATFFHHGTATSNNAGPSAPNAAAAKAAKRKCRLGKGNTLFPEPPIQVTSTPAPTSRNADVQARCTSPSVAEIAHAKENAASSSSSTLAVAPLPTLVKSPSLQLLPTDKQNLQHLTSEELSLQFLKAVKSGDVTYMERLEQQAAKLSPLPPAGGFINIRGMWESTPLIYACQYGHAKAAMWLLQQGANVHCQNEKGVTALLLASLEGMTDVVEWILANNVTSTTKTDTPVPGDKLSEHLSIDKQIGVVYNSVVDLNIRVSPLLAASMNGHVDIVTRLLAARDASNNSVSVNLGVAASASAASAKQFALLLAAKYGHASVVRILIKHGADFATSDSNGNHALLLACEAAKDECAMELLRLLPTTTSSTRKVEGSRAADSPMPPPSNAYIVAWKQANAHGLTALHFAAANGLLHVVQHMVVTLQWGLDQNFLNAVSVNRRECALLMACRKRQSEVVQLLINVGADFELADRGGTTALQVLKRDKKDDLVKLCERTRRTQSKTAAPGSLEKCGSSDTESMSTDAHGANVLSIDVGESEAMHEDKVSVPECSQPQAQKLARSDSEDKSSPASDLIKDQSPEVVAEREKKPNEARNVRDARKIHYDAPKVDWEEMRIESRELDSMNSMLARAENGRNASSRVTSTRTMSFASSGKNSLEPLRGALESPEEIVEDETKEEAPLVDGVVKGKDTQIDSSDANELESVRRSLIQQASAINFAGEEETKPELATNDNKDTIADAAPVHITSIKTHDEVSSDDSDKKASPVKPKHRRKEHSPRKAKERHKTEDSTSTRVHDDAADGFSALKFSFTHESRAARASQTQKSIPNDFNEPTIEAVALDQRSSQLVPRDFHDHGPVGKLVEGNGAPSALARDRSPAEGSKDDESIPLPASPAKEKRKKKKHQHSVSSAKRKQPAPN